MSPRVGTGHGSQPGSWAPAACRIARTTWLSGIVVSISQSAIARSRGLDFLKVCQEPAVLLGRLAERVACPGCQPLREDLCRSAQQDDAVELGVEPDLVLFASGHE